MRDRKKEKKPPAPKKNIDSLLPIVNKCDAKRNRFYEHNIIRSFQQFQIGAIGPIGVKLTGENVICQNLKTFDVDTLEPWDFTRRLTSIAWHPTKPNVIALASKGGELVFRRFKNFYKEHQLLSSFEGTGPGGAITDISYDPFLENHVFLTSIDGTVKRWNYENSKNTVLLDCGNTGDFDRWYCSVCSTNDTGIVIVGDTSGTVTLLSKEMKPIGNYKLHKKKVNSVELSKTNSWLLATASLDQTVKVWDIRKLVPKEPLETLVHEKPVNGAYFSKTNCNRLLTSDQNSQLRVYSVVNFDLETLIYHPHRQFQHITPITASWHPCADLIVIGRYPDPSWPMYEKELKSIDIINAATGEVQVQLTTDICKMISSLNEFNCTGEVLASAMGSHVPYWMMSCAKERKGDSHGTKKRGCESDDDDDDKKPPPPKKMPTSRKKKKA